MDPFFEVIITRRPERSGSDISALKAVGIRLLLQAHESMSRFSIR
jgi:hypothetical protein